jgi:type II secretory pathway pseudopilin PulG
METNGPIDIEKLVATSSRPPASAPRPARLDWRMKVILALAGLIVLAVVLQGIHRRQVAQVEAQRAKAEQAEQDQAVDQGRLRHLAARLEEVQACNSEPRIGEPEAILVAYAECFGARVQETRALGRPPVRVYVVSGGGSWTVEGGIVTSYRK